MKLFGFDITRQKQQPFESALMRLVAAQDGMGVYGPGLAEFFGQYVTPETCMRSPTVCAIVTAVARRLSVSPVEVFKTIEVKTDTDEPNTNDTRMRRQRQPNHPVAKLLGAPNKWQTRTAYWLDATSRMMRYGNYFAYLSSASTGPIRELIPLHPRQVQVEQDIESWKVSYRFNGQDLDLNKVHHARGPARNGLVGDSPINDINVSIGLEIAAENFGATFFNNGALPLMIFKYAQGMQAFKKEEDEKQFLADIQSAFTGSRRHRAMLLPKGIDVGDPVKIENDKSQFLETRRYQRTVIAGAFGVPPHLVGDLERATFNNVEQQSADFTVNCVLPIAQWFESAMENDLLTADDRNRGIIIRFNLETAQRADFKSRQEGLLIQRNAGVISPNDWREMEGQNPISEEDGGEDYIRPLNYVVSGSEADTGGGPLVKPTAPAAPAPAPKPNGAGNGAAKDMVISILGGLRDLRERLEAMESRVQPITVNVDVPRQAAPVVYVQPAEVKFEQGAINIAPSPITVEGDEITIAPPNVHVAAPEAPRPMDKVIERDAKTGRLSAIRLRPVK